MGMLKTHEDVVINEISRKFENRYRDRRNNFRDSSQNRSYSQDSRRWQSYNNNSSHQQRQYEPAGNTEQLNIDSSTTRKEEVQPPNSEQVTPITTTGQHDRFDTPTRRQNRDEKVQSPMLRGSYTQITVNPMQLSDAEFTNWIEKLVEVRKNRQERKPRPYRNFRKPYNNDTDQKKPALRNKLQSAQELDVQSIMTSFNCEYDDVVEAVDLYNMDVEESQTT